MDSADIDFNPNCHFASCSVESTLSVPTEFIFRETSASGDRGKGGNTSSQRNFIFSKSEVSTLLRVSMLSSELDAILTLAYDALDRSHKCKLYQKYIIQESTNNAATILLRALLPVLDVHAQTSKTALDHATSEDFGISRVLNELEACADDLGKFAEQNHNIADQLEGYMGPLSDEKRAIAEIEEACVERIQNLSVLALGNNNTSDVMNVDEESEGGGEKSFISMSELCESLFSKQQSTLEGGVDTNNNNNGTPPAEEQTPDFTESQMFAAEALQTLQSNSREN